MTPRYYTIVYVAVGTSKPPLSIFCQILKKPLRQASGGRQPLIIPATQGRLALQDSVAAIGWPIPQPKVLPRLGCDFFGSGKRRSQRCNN